MSPKGIRNTLPVALGAAGLACLGSMASADQVFLDDLIVDGSACIGMDCANGESFSFDTLRLKENNLRIKFDDTSSSGSFPNVDWQLTANDSTNGGLNKFSIEDVTNGKVPFTVIANAPSNSLYVKETGRVGFGTTSPTVNLHVVDGNSPALRLDQDGSDGFTSQIWDIAGNETNFFVRDVTNSSKLPFRIKPGAPDNSVSIGTNGVGLGLQTATAALHVKRSDDTATILVEDTGSGATQLLNLVNNGTAFMTLDNGTTAWNIQNNSEELRFTNSDVAGIEMSMTTAGNMTIAGTLVTGTAGVCTSASPCDGVFDPEVYSVPAITEYASEMWANGHLPAVGPTLPDQPVDVTAKMLAMLNALEHAHIYIDQLNTTNQEQSAELTALRARMSQVDALEQRLNQLEADRG